MKFLIRNLVKKEPRKFEPKILKSVKSILVRPLGSSAIGDAVIHTAHLKILKNIYPAAKIGVIAKGGGGEQKSLSTLKTLR